MHELEAAEARRTTVDVDALVDGMLDAHRRAEQWQMHDRELGVGVDLVRLGLVAVAALLAQ